MKALAYRHLLLVADCVRSLWELALARRALSRLTMAQITRRNDSGHGIPSACDAALIERIAFVLPRVAGRVPWRSDCLVQALAAQRWLQAKAIRSRIVIGVDNKADEPFTSHAWLLCGDKVVTGGDIGRYQPIFGEPTECSRGTRG